MKTKSLVVKDKMKDYIAHTSLTDSSHTVPRYTDRISALSLVHFYPIDRHVSKQDKVGKLYRQNQTSVFSLDGEDDDDDSMP